MRAERTVGGKNPSKRCDALHGATLEVEGCPDSGNIPRRARWLF